MRAKAQSANSGWFWEARADAPVGKHVMQINYIGTINEINANKRHNIKKVY